MVAGGLGDLFFRERFKFIVLHRGRSHVENVSRCRRRNKEVRDYLLCGGFIRGFFWSASLAPTEVTCILLHVSKTFIEMGFCEPRKHSACFLRQIFELHWPDKDQKG